MSFFKRSTPLSAHAAFIVLSVLMFFFSAQVSLTIYIDSSYLKDTIMTSPELIGGTLSDNTDNLVGTLYTFASLITLLALVFAPRILRKFGNYRWTLGIVVLHVLLLLGLAIFDSAWLIIPLFIIESALISILYFNFDIFLERYSKIDSIGTIRGLFLVISAIAWILPPFFAGKIADQYGFSQVYLLGALIMLPTIFIIMRYFTDFADLEYDDVPFLFTKNEASKHPNVGNILVANFFLQFFYAWMIIYSPIYFHDSLGFSYDEFGLILMVALSAFVIFPYPAGWLADHVMGEKEMLIGGFFLMGLSALCIPTFADSGIGILFWIVILFIGRTGASIVEAMSETYFFKQIEGRNAGLIGYFRRSRPLAFIVAPILASVLLEFNIITLHTLFYVLAAIMIFASGYMFRLVDTK